MNATTFKEMVTYDFGCLINLQQPYYCCDTCDCNCDCDAGDCDCNNYCDNDW